MENWWMNTFVSLTFQVLHIISIRNLSGNGKNQPNTIFLRIIVWCLITPTWSLVVCIKFTLIRKPFHGSHQLDLSMIQLPGIENGAFIVSPDTVWYTWFLLVLSLCCNKQACSIWAWQKESNPLHHPHSKYLGKTCCGTRQWHRAIWYMVPVSDTELFGTTCTTSFVLLPQARCRPWMQDASIGVWMVQRYVMNRNVFSTLSLMNTMWTWHITMFGACSSLLWMSCKHSTCFMQCYSKINCGHNLQLWSAPVICLQMGKDCPVQLFHGVG
jgi:hypothetical protein